MRKRKGEENYETMKEYFDLRLKRIFDGFNNEMMDFPVQGIPDNPTARVEDGYMEISLEEMKDIFEPVIQKVLRLVQEQIDAVANRGHVSAVIMVGGFSSSAHLYKRVKEYTTRAFKSTKFQFIRPTDAWSAVARGAVVCGLHSIEIHSRRACRNYGTRLSTTYNWREHSEFSDYLLWNKYDGCWDVYGLIQWYVNKGDEIPGKTKKNLFSFHDEI